MKDPPERRQKGPIGENAERTNKKEDKKEDGPIRIEGRKRPLNPTVGTGLPTPKEDRKSTKNRDKKMALKTLRKKTETKRRIRNQTFALFPPDNLFDSLVPFAHLSNSRQDKTETKIVNIKTRKRHDKGKTKTRHKDKRQRQGRQDQDKTNTRHKTTGKIQDKLKITQHKTQYGKTRQDSTRHVTATTTKTKTKTCTLKDISRG
jgi:hypothetical protein